MRTEPPAGVEAREFHVTSAAALVLAAGVLVFDGVPWYAYGVLVALAAWYAALAVPLARRRGGHDTRGLVYLLGAAGWVSALVLCSPFTAALLVAVYIHAFWMLERLWLATACIALATAGTGFAVATHVAGERMAGVVVLCSAVSSFLIGNEVGKLTRKQAEQERVRARLIEDLEDARAELAAAHRLEGARGERERLGREIHDTLAQGFTSLVMLVQAADAAVDIDPELAHRQLQLAERTARENLTEARALVAAGQPGVLGQPTIDSVVRRLAEQLGEVADLKCTVVTDELKRELSPNEKIVIVRSTQEALANIRRHARARQVSVTLRSDDAGTTLDIVDDGCGFAPDDAYGFGLTGMRSRIEEIGGELMIASTVGAGTRVRVVIP